jgi:hypothetical protein
VRANHHLSFQCGENFISPPAPAGERRQCVGRNGL